MTAHPEILLCQGSGFYLSGERQKIKGTPRADVTRVTAWSCASVPATLTG